MKKAVIFDLDGTLADSLKSIWHSANYAIGTCGFEPIPLEKYNFFVGDGADALIKRCLAYSGDVNGDYYEKAFLQYQLYFKDHCMYEVKPYDGIISVLKELKAKGMKLAVFSNKPHERTIDVVRELFGEDLFEEVLGHTDDIPKKPNPRGVHVLAERMGVSMEETIYVGDTSTDMMTGKGSGALTIGVLWGFRDRAELEKYKADYMIEKPAELLQFITF